MLDIHLMCTICPVDAVKAEIARAKERMDLKHQNTSKWAKHQLRRGANADADSRKALQEQVLYIPFGVTL